VRQKHHNDVEYTESLPVGVDGYYNHEQDTIYIRKGLIPRRDASVREHEMVHKYHRHQPLDSLPEHHAREIWVEEEAARRLVPFGQLLEAFNECASIESMSTKLGVDGGIICARMLGLTDLEQTMINMCAFHCITNENRAQQVMIETARFN
jgi:hypothetical protein